MVFTGSMVGCSRHTSRAARSAATTTAQSRSGNGDIIGQLLEVGGPAPGVGNGHGLPLRGSVEVHSGSLDGSMVARTSAGADGRFSVTVPTGSYVLTGSSSMVTGVLCVSTPVTVSPNASLTSINVVCNIP